MSRYQRPLDEEKVEYWVKNWDPGKTAPVIVNARECAECGDQLTLEDRLFGIETLCERCRERDRDERLRTDI